MVSTPTQRGFIPLLKGSWEATIRERFGFFTFVTLFILAYSTDLLVPWAIGYSINVFVQQGFTDQAYYQAAWGVGAYFGLRLLSTILHHYGRYLQSYVAYSAKMTSLQKVFTSLINYRLNWHTARHSGESLAKLNRSTLAVKNVIGQHSWQIIESGVKITLAAGALFALDFWVALNVAVMSALSIFTMLYFNSHVTRTIRRNNAFENKINKVCLEYLSNIVTVKILGLEKVAENYLALQREEGERCTRSMSKYTELKWAVINIGYALVIASSLMIYFWARRFDTGPLDVAAVYVLITYLDKIFQSINSFTAYFTGIIEACTAYEDASDIINGNPETANVTTLRPKNSSGQIKTDGVKVNRLSFRYSDHSSAVDATELHFRAGERVALIGASGCGKSTLLKVLAGALTPENAEIVSSNGELICLEQLAKETILIPQEPQIFSETLLYNLTMGEELDFAAIEKVASVCRLDRLIQRLPEGWDTDLSENGLNLSGGERQRIAIARALLRADDKRFILLDEPTASLDPKTERELLEGLFQHYPDHTVISSCHRWNLLPLFDRVVELDNGLVIHQGPPEGRLSGLDLLPRNVLGETENEILSRRLRFG